MFVSFNWLKQYIEGSDKIDPRDLGLKLTMSTVEVESVTSSAENLDRIVVGQVKKISPHPNADRLKLVVVNIGDEEVIVVCGGVNLKEKMLVALALPGAKVRWHGEGELIELKPTSVRGVESFGMICASDEIGLGAEFPVKEKSEILDLTDLNLQIGRSLGEQLKTGDVVFEIDNKSLTNRPDLWGHYGLAREVAAIYGLKLKELNLFKIKAGKGKRLKVKVANSHLCSRYSAVAIDGIKVDESPTWLKERLSSIGQKPINNIVDITNYVMFDLGQPLHAFSAKKIVGGEIIVRTAHDGEKLVTLDKLARELTTHDLVIADKEKAIALAGIMGALDSEVEIGTTSVIIESANFDATCVRKTGQRLGLRTEASMRFEKSLDPNLVELALQKTINLILEIIPGSRVVSEIIDEKDFRLNCGPLDPSWSFIDSRIGQKIERKKTIQTLQRLGFAVKDNKLGLAVRIPSWRATKDVSIKEDIIEEITRIFGYDNLTPSLPRSVMVCWEENKLRQLEREIKNILSGVSAASEVLNYSFVAKSFFKKIGCQEVDNFTLLNPWTEDLCYLRRSLLPGLLGNIETNLRFFNNLNIFEVGKVFIDDEAGELTEPNGEQRLPSQEVYAAGAISKPKGETTFYLAKGVVETILSKLGIEFDFQITTEILPFGHPKQSLSLLVAGEEIGFVASLNPRVGRALDLDAEIALWQINLSKLQNNYPVLKKFEALPKFPSVELDLSLIIGEEEQWKDIQGLIKAIEPRLIKSVKLLDVFKNDKMKAGNKSLTCRIVYQSDERTLNMEEVNKIQETVINQLEKGIGAVVRR
jgi:phenylalanyl-tRNA synthetase beta chain